MVTSKKNKEKIAESRKIILDLLGASDDYNNARRKLINTKCDLM